MDLLLVPERSSLKHQRYDKFELIDELKSRPRNCTTKAINFSMLSTSRWSPNDARKQSQKSTSSIAGLTGRYQRLAEESVVDWDHTEEEWNADSFYQIGWASREEKDPQGTRKEENHIYPPICECHSYWWQAEGSYCLQHIRSFILTETNYMGRWTPTQPHEQSTGDGGMADRDLDQTWDLFSGVEHLLQDGIARCWEEGKARMHWRFVHWWMLFASAFNGFLIFSKCPDQLAWSTTTDLTIIIVMCSWKR